MRITGGTHRGRVLASPQGDKIRPTSDKARLAVFNMLTARSLIDEAHVADIFSGTGAYGLEAISRGAVSAVFIDQDRDALDLARGNAETFKLVSQCKFLNVDAAHLSQRPVAQEKIDLVFMDPPYHQNLILPALVCLQKGDWLVAGATLILETERGGNLDLPAGFMLETRRSHGAADILMVTFGAD
jgi:16S rRNA (guanine966-N2)-methyltransferase